MFYVHWTAYNKWNIPNLAGLMESNCLKYFHNSLRFPPFFSVGLQFSKDSEPCGTKDICDWSASGRHFMAYLWHFHSISTCTPLYARNPLVCMLSYKLIFIISYPANKFLIIMLITIIIFIILQVSQVDALANNLLNISIEKTSLFTMDGRVFTCCNTRQLAIT